MEKSWKTQNMWQQDLEAEARTLGFIWHQKQLMDTLYPKGSLITEKTEITMFGVNISCGTTRVHDLYSHIHGFY